jgi:tetratricopeptide (TPR) repeat protein
LIHSQSEKKTSVVDLSAKYKVIRDFSEYQNVITNTAWAPELAKDQYSPTYSYFEESAERWKYLSTQLKQNSVASLAQVIDWISSHEAIDPSTRSVYRREAGGTIARRNNVQSLVYFPESQALHLSVSDLRFSRPMDGEYKKMRLRFDPDGFMQMKIESGLRSKWSSDQNRVKAKALYREAGELAGEYGDYPKALSLIAQAAKLDPEDPAYPLMFVSVSLIDRAWNGPAPEPKELQTWEQMLRESSKLERNSRFRQVHELFMARILDLQGKRQQAQEVLQRIECSHYKRPEKAVRRQKMKPYQLRDARSMLIEFPMADFYLF